MLVCVSITEPIDSISGRRSNGLINDTHTPSLPARGRFAPTSCAHTQQLPWSGWYGRHTRLGLQCSLFVAPQPIDRSDPQPPHLHTHTHTHTTETQNCPAAMWGRGGGVPCPKKRRTRTLPPTLACLPDTLVSE
mmetsp:Transcript_29353/g.84938  ORF Transcript_29353/g.84938 Transcript_29353/m.84938 type:complete len:134 (-) Transcript_29353:3056-3457(-)